jgi:hypothetical protein
MTRFGLCMMSLTLAMALWVVPASAQDKFIMGYGGVT